MGIFDNDLLDDIDEVELLPEYERFTPGTYRATVTSAEMEESKAGKPMLVLRYTDEARPEVSIKEYLTIPKGGRSSWDSTEETKIGNNGKSYTTSEAQRNEKSIARLKTRLVGLGIPPERVGTVEPSDLIDIPVIVKVGADRSNPEYPDSVRIVSVKSSLGGNASSPSLPTAAAKENPFAKKGKK